MLWELDWTLVGWGGSGYLMGMPGTGLLNASGSLPTHLRALETAEVSLCHGGVIGLIGMFFQ